MMGYICIVLNCVHPSWDPPYCEGCALTLYSDLHTSHAVHSQILYMCIYVWLRAGVYTPWMSRTLARQLTCCGLDMASAAKHSKATAAKAVPKTPTKSRGGTEPTVAQSAKRQAEADLATPDAKKPYTDGQLKSQCLNYFTRVQNGQVAKATDEQKAEARDAVATMQKLGDKDKVDFAKAFFSAKQTKDFGFLKDYNQKIGAKRLDGEKVLENYFTRTYQHLAIAIVVIFKHYFS